MKWQWYEFRIVNKTGSLFNGSRVCRNSQHFRRVKPVLIWPWRLCKPSFWSELLTQVTLSCPYVGSCVRGDCSHYKVVHNPSRSSTLKCNYSSGYPPLNLHAKVPRGPWSLDSFYCAKQEVEFHYLLKD